MRAGLVAAGATAVAAVPGIATAHEPLTTVALPNGFAPEGIEVGRFGQAYVSNRVNGSVYRLDLRTGEGSVLFAGPGTPSLGLKVDGRGRLFVAGGTGGNARVVDTESGALLATYQFAAPGTAFVNDVVLVGRTAYFTDSWNPVLYTVTLGRGGELPQSFQTLPVTGVTYTPGVVNANGIETTPDGSALLVVQSNTGVLHRVDPATGAATPVDLGGASLTLGDGLLRDGRTLYVVRNRANEIAVVELDGTGASGTITTRLTDPAFDVPTTVAAYAGRLYLPNARFTTPVTPDTAYAVVSVAP
ncbi:MAG: superoxide dismutase [Hamadaea sp.]|nr:superoxide dismutase [Hamadaea sp.]